MSEESCNWHLREAILKETLGVVIRGAHRSENAELNLRFDWSTVSLGKTQIWNKHIVLIT